MSISVEDSSDRSDELQSSEVIKTDVLAKEASASVAVREQPGTSSTNEAEGDCSAGTQNEADTVYVNGHPVIENGMTTIALNKLFSLWLLIERE
jgi:hypothetical protein